MPPSATPAPQARESAALLAAFRVLSSNDLYTIAPKKSILRGYEYYRQRRVHSYAWSPSGTALTAWVQGHRPRPYAVTWSLDNGFLAASCECPAWEPHLLCKHVVCACFTTKNLLSPEVFQLPNVIEPSRDRLRAELLGGAEEDERPRETVALNTGFEIVIDAQHQEPVLSLRRNGMRVDWSLGWRSMAAFPPELAPLLNASAFTLGYGEDPLLRYLRQGKGAYPLVFETRGEAVALRWDPSVKCVWKAALEAAGDQVTGRAVCLADGIELERFVRFRSFVIDVRGGRLLHLKDEKGWNTWLALQRGMDLRHPFLARDGILAQDVRMVLLPDTSPPGTWPRRNAHPASTCSRREFQNVRIDVTLKDADRVARELKLTVNGRAQRLHRSNFDPDVPMPAYRLILIPPSDSGDMPTAGYRLRAECRWRDANMAPSASVFGFFPYLEHAHTLSAPLQARKRKSVLYKAFFDLLSVTDPKERDRRLRMALHGNDFRSRAVMKEAQWLVRSALESFFREDLRLTLHHERWELQPVDKAQEALLYAIPAEVFGTGIFRGMPRCDEMAVDAQSLFHRLPELLEKLTAARIQLLYRDKPVHLSRWDCGVNVERGPSDMAGQAGKGIDWFEITAELRCDGVLVEDAEWRAALQQGGFLDTERGFRVLDRSTLERLRTIVGFTQHAGTPREAAQIVRVPRLQILDWLALREQGITVSLPDEDEAMLARLMGFKRITPVPLPPALQATLRPYQHEGYGWLAFLYAHRFGACLADDMGLGKTLQVISLLAAIQEGLIQRPRSVRGPHLVVAPTSLLFNWEQELARFAPNLKVRVYRGSEPTLEAGDGEVVLTTYGLVRRHIEAWERAAFHVIVFDEAQAVKNIHADTTGAVRRLKGYFRVAMTGTPLENHLGEYFSVIDLCMPGLLGEHDRFKTELKRMQGGALDRLLRRTRPFILRRTKAEILHDLPPKIESEMFLDLTDRQKALYRQTVANIRSTIEEAYRTKTQAQAQLIALTAILKLRQVCLSPRLVTKQEEEPSPKLNFLMEKLPVLLDEGHSALVFSQFTGFLDLVQEACDRHAVPYYRLDGATPPAARKGRVRDFQTGERPGVFLLSLKAGGQGLNLTKATYVFHLDPWWNPAVESQASDRAHRIGQQRTVTIVRLLMRHSIEEKMIALKQRKLDLYDAVMRGTVRRAGQAVLTRADFEFLLSSGSG